MNVFLLLLFWITQFVVPAISAPCWFNYPTDMWRGKGAKSFAPASNTHSFVSSKSWPGPRKGNLAIGDRGKQARTPQANLGWKYVTCFPDLPLWRSDKDWTGVTSCWLRVVHMCTVWNAKKSFSAWKLVTGLSFSQIIATIVLCKWNFYMFISVWEKWAWF